MVEKTMYYFQKGCLPFVLGTLARFLAVGLFLYAIFGTYFQWLETKQVNSIEIANEGIFSSLIVSLIVIIMFFPVPYIMGGIFPTIRVMPKGIIYRHLVIGGGLIKWNEIEEITYISRDKKNIGVYIKRKGWFLLNGMWLLSFIGMIFTNQIIPVLILSNGIKDRDLLIKDIANFVDSSIIRVDK
jgi:hypothetical protein